MNYIEVQKLRKHAGLGLGFVNDIFGDANFVSNIFGQSAAQQGDAFWNTQFTPEQIAARQQAAAEDDAKYRQESQRLDRNLNQEQARLKAQEDAERQQQLAQQQAAASKRNENLMAAYMAGNNDQLRQQNQFASNSNALTNQQLTSNMVKAKQQVAAEEQNRVANDYIAKMDAVKNRALGEQASRDIEAGVGQRNYQAFDRNNLAGYTQDQINAINAAAQKKGLKIGDITQVSFNDKGAVNGFRVRKGALNRQPQQPVPQKPTAQIASTSNNNVYDARKLQSQQPSAPKPASTPKPVKPTGRV